MRPLPIIISFGIPNKNQKVMRFLTDFRQLNKRLVQKPFPLPKINQILYEIDGMQWASTIDLKMGYYAIRLDPDAQQYCTLITPWDKYKYLRLPMCISCAPHMFLDKMSALVAHFEFAQFYIDDLLVLTNGSFEDHFKFFSFALNESQGVCGENAAKKHTKS